MPKLTVILLCTLFFNPNNLLYAQNNDYSFFHLTKEIYDSLTVENSKHHESKVEMICIEKFELKVGGVRKDSAYNVNKRNLIYMIIDSIASGLEDLAVRDSKNSIYVESRAEIERKASKNNDDYATGKINQAQRDTFNKNVILEDLNRCEKTHRLTGKIFLKSEKGDIIIFANIKKKGSSIKDTHICFKKKINIRVDSQYVKAILSNN